MMTSLLALIQGVYFFVTGLWPIIHIRSFMKVTGPKTDTWLVKTMGGVLVVMGATLLLALARGEINPSIAFLAMGAALALTVSEVIYVLRKVISPIYLLDGAVEVILIIAWLIAL